MEDLRKRLAPDRQITTELSGPARELIARQGYDPVVAWMARPTAVATRNIDVSGHRQR
jgi:hypothetical protein